MNSDPLRKGVPEIGQMPVTPAELLEQQKQQLHEESLRSGRIVELGMLAKPENADLWTGPISLRRRIESKELTMEEVKARTALLGQYFFKTRNGAGVRCIDGSTVQGYDDNDPRWFSRGLGPQVQGGTLGEAVAWRMRHGNPKQEKISMIQDLKRVAEIPSRYKAGGHTDDHAGADRNRGSEKSGCGQYDGQARKLPLYRMERPSGLMAATADALLDLAGQKAAPNDFERLQRGASMLLDHPDYLPGAGDAIHALNDLNPDGLETVVRPHNEVSLTVNYVPGTSFHRDHYNAGTGAKIQNFGLDVWYIIEKYGADGYALIIDAVATAMDLTDGTLLLFARIPNDR